MFSVISNSWPLLLGMLLLMLGNGIQSTLLGVRGGQAGFGTFEMSLVMSAYFAGFLVASRLTPGMIRRVGHVRVFAALGSLISAVLILYPTVQNPYAWMAGRMVIGFCFCGVYVTAESWLNDAATNETRGQALSVYMIVQTLGIIIAQAIVLVPDASGFLLFVIPSVLVSIAFAPILLSISPTPAFETTKPMSLPDLFHNSPLGCVGMFLLGGVFSAQFGMSAVYASSAGLTLAQLSMFVASFYVGAMVLQYPLGWLSDRMDRRRLIAIIALVGGVASIVAALNGAYFYALIGAAFIIGGCSNPLYSMLIAHSNDFLEAEDMPSASAGLLFINGLGAIAGPIITGWLMGVAGPQGFFLFLAALMLVLGGYGVYRMTQRPGLSADETGSFPALSPGVSPVAVEAAQDYAIEEAIEHANEQDALRLEQEGAAVAN
ncbi:MFS transporter [Poseidonocella sedimentorum]|uniref:Predicted arabinose efflux permease, MFS family n=1 Tax=Poseidonocella sedimentorum TaxID=871652 RepID=A0A1I6DYP6_9RHOB|nr:MFS transporter [Poseidonocella sedimentorum]SFR10660.1 Predicted arabinose efflux permease, MFS family [Poseidonocella sedimentorum]